MADFTSKNSTTGKSTLDNIAGVLTGQTSPKVEVEHTFDYTQIALLGLTILVVGLLLVWVSKKAGK